MMIDAEKYMEKPRPNLYSIVKKLKNQDQSYRRVCYVCKVSDQANKAELEKDQTNFFKRVAEDRRFTGLCLIVGNYIVHLIETTDEVLMKDFMGALNNEFKETKLYLSLYIVHFTEENPSAEFEDWYCKNVTMGGPSIEIKNKTTHEKLWTIYNNMCRIGAEISSVASKGPS